MNRPTWLNALVFVALVAIGAGSRLIDAAPNFAAIGACALFAGFFFSSRLVAVGVPVVAMLISDSIIGWHDTRQMAVIYACLAMPVLFRSILGSRPALGRTLVCSLVCSAAFFLFTNLAVWGFSSLYSKDVAGLTRCFAMAVPFFRYTLASDLGYAVAIFGGYLLLTRYRPAPVAQFALQPA